MATRIIDDSKLNDIAVAIQYKDGGGQMTVDDMPTRIANIPSGGGVKTQKVNFYDFKGNLAHSYTAEEAAELTEMPEAPTIEGFTFQKWNWSLESIKTWLTKHENDNCELNVGGLYVTTDGHTRIYMHLREAELANLEMPFCITQMDGTVTIDWGDNSEPETITTAGTYSHLWQLNEYPADVIINIDYTPSGATKLVLGKLVGSNGYGLFNNDNYYTRCVEKVEYGLNVNFTQYSEIFKNCINLKEINLPNSITSTGWGMFNGCTNLSSIAIPNGITSIGARMFNGCTNLSSIAIPNGITSISAYTFSGCTNLSPIAIPNGITSISAYTFNECTNLSSIAIPNGIKSIDYNAFSGCTNLSSIAIPNGIKSIGNSAFYGCKMLYIIDLTAFIDPQSIPTLVNTNAFQDIPAQAQFQVINQEMYDAFTTATNWSTYASKFVIKGA